MNKILPWVKSNWLIVVLCLLILAVLPTAIIISSGMNKALREQVQKSAAADATELGNHNIQYNIESPIPGVPDVELQNAANADAIAWFKERREEIQAEAAEVWTRALAINRADHDVLMTGLFPKPAATDDALVLRTDYTRRFVEGFAGTLLKAMNAGPPPAPGALASSVVERASERHQQLLAQTGNSALTLEQSDELRNELTRIRIDAYTRRAAELAVYADGASFPDIIDYIPVNIPSLRQCWLWQEAAWALRDFAAAVATANTAVPGRAKGVPGSVVKRLIRVEVTEPAPPSRSRSEENFDAPAEPGGIVALNPAVSVTGRVGGRGTDNTLYDVRHIEAEVIVATRYLPVLIDAISSTNFMTVLDLDLERIDPMEHLAQGYFYGDGEHVVKAKLVIETIWFREWILPLMPPEVLTERGIELPAAEGEEGAEGQTPAGG